jgi:tripartite-type tricarboxylate transporter receptor subunit TctC
MNRRLVLAAALALASGAAPAHAQAVADFYRGRTVTVLVGVSVGGEYDILTRLMARHIAKQIPGFPATVAHDSLTPPP